MKYITSHVRSVAKDSNAVVVMKDEGRSDCRACSYHEILHPDCLRRDVNKAFAEVTGPKVNRGVGYMG